MIPPLANRFVAGEAPETAFEHAESVNNDGIGAILNLLGEHYESAEPARADTDAYLDLITRVAERDASACISVKPSQIGIDVSADLFAENLRRIVDQAAEQDAFVWTDMEDADTTDTTLDVFVELAEQYPWTLGQCLQSNLKRTHDDLERTVDVPGKIRMVKGAYDEPSSISYKDKKRVNEAYKHDLEFLFEHRDRGVAIGSHDPEMISLARHLGHTFNTSYEIQMLMGVREDEQQKLAAEGIDVWQYAPYGDKWLSYFYRRVRERKENALFAARALVGI